MEGTPRPSGYTSLIFSHEWPPNHHLMGDLVEAVERGFDDWVVLPLAGISFEALREESEALSMRMQGLEP